MERDTGKRIKPWFAIDEDIINEMDWVGFKKDFAEISMENVDIDILLKKLFNSASDLGLLDKVFDLLNGRNQPTGRKGILSEISKFVSNAKAITTDFDFKSSVFLVEQFKPENNSEEEKYANIIYLSNAIARMLQVSKQSLTNKLDNVDEMVKNFFGIKTKAMEEILTIRSELGPDNDRLLVEFAQDEQLEGVNRFFLIAIPGYMEPFRIQFDIKTMQALENGFDIFKLDKIPFFSMNAKNVGEYMRSNFPLKLTPQLETVLYDIYMECSNGNNNIPDFLLERIKYYCEYLPEVTTQVGRQVAMLRVKLRELTLKLAKLRKQQRRQRTGPSRDKVGEQADEIKKQADEIQAMIDEQIGKLSQGIGGYGE